MRPDAIAGQRGQVQILLAASLLVLVGSAGLAIDSGLGYVSRAMLNAAVDAAGIAAARAVAEGADQGAQAANARRAARDFFAANYPAGWLGSTPTLDEPIVSFDRGKVTIDVSARAQLPLSLMRVAGFNVMTVAAASQTVRKDLDMAFVMDTSGSMSSVAPAVRDAAVSFLRHFNPTTDRVALVHFAAGARVDDPIRTSQRGFDRPTLERHVEDFDFSGLTNHAEGFWHGRDQLNRIAAADRSSLRVIVFFSDGSPNSFSSRFRVNGSNCVGTLTTGDGPRSGRAPRGLYRHDRQNQAMSGQCYQGDDIADALAGLPAFYNAHAADDREFPVVTDVWRTVTASTASNATAWNNINLAARNLPELMAAKARDEGIHVFTIGLGSQLRQPFGVADGSSVRTGEDLLKCMANIAQSQPPDALPARCHDAAKPVGSYCHAATEDELKPCFAQLASEILRITK